VLKLGLEELDDVGVTDRVTGIGPCLHARRTLGCCREELPVSGFLADAGKRILLVSTDPASNLDEMLGVVLSPRLTAVPDVERLSALNIDPEKAADEYRERVLAPYRPIWTKEQVQELREQLAGACTMEIAAFDEFAELLASDESSVPFDHVLFDTAPTGHTLRLLSLPRAWTGFLQSTTEGASCLGPHSGLKMQEARFEDALQALGDRERTTVVLVTRPDRWTPAKPGRARSRMKRAVIPSPCTTKSGRPSAS
jgi:arsenite-transporting ATPase